MSVLSQLFAKVRYCGTLATVFISPHRLYPENTFLGCGSLLQSEANVVE